MIRETCLKRKWKEKKENWKQKQTIKKIQIERKTDLENNTKEKQKETKYTKKQNKSNSTD